MARQLERLGRELCDRKPRVLRLVIRRDRRRGPARSAPPHRRPEQLLEPTAGRRVRLQRARKSSPARRDTRDRLGIAHDGGQARAQRRDFLNVLDRDTAVAIGQALVTGKLADHLGRAD